MGRSAAREATKKGRSRYGRTRGRRGRVVVALLVVLALVALAVPVVREAPDVVLRFTHPLEHEGTIREAAAERGLEPALVAAVIRTESRFEEGVESPKGAYGLMQIRPETAQFIAERSGIPGNYRVPETNIGMGTWYLDYLRGRYGGNERLTLAAYNSGEGSVDGWLAEGGYDVEVDFPYQETREYVGSVLEAREVYARLYGSDLNGPRETGLFGR